MDAVHIGVSSIGWFLGLPLKYQLGVAVFTFTVGAYAVLFLYLAAQGLWSQVPPFTVPEYYHWGRLLTAFMGTLTVLVVYLVGRRLRTRRAGLMAAALLGGCYLHVIHSHYATFDVMVGFLASLTLLFSQLIVSEEKGTQR